MNDVRRTWPEIPGYEYFTSEVKCLASGKVIFIGSADGGYVVNVQSNADECIRYCHLKTCTVSTNDNVEIGQEIGRADRYARIEYCTVRDPNVNVVRIYNKTYYKQDPTPIITDNYEIITSVPIDFASNVAQTIKLTPAQLAEFGNSRGDNIVEF